MITYVFPSDMNSLENMIGFFATSDAYEDAKPGETVEITGKGRIDYFDARQVLGSSWGIRRRPVPGS
ncbi:hypothetical protein [Ruegeria profundi]|uniref:Uncharacterized protein n=1 Tax=Ruegeria profundi TaxID=1685378 RepID=A0A0X3TS03_9RHOB|nr:hypothetical protein [Ruegeria profundi]KUJ78513.1 hypothetical protein AVO44_12415 [Ruegeria profundi]